MVGNAMKSLVLVGLLAGCSASQAQVANVDAPASQMTEAEMRKAAAALMGAGYLERGTVPSSLVINAPPPAPGSAAEARDQEGAAAALAIQDTPRFKLARVDADIFSQDGTSMYSCAAGFEISAKATPKTYALLRKTVADLGMSTSPTKHKYMRKRPFMVNGQPNCTPEQSSFLAKDGSYPSGHSAIGYGWGLILAEIIPDRAAELVKRGMVFGDSRRVCNVHWLSDIEAGQDVAAAVVARLHDEPQFRADIEAARAEIAATRASLPAPDCALEKEALGTAG